MEKSHDQMADEMDQLMKNDDLNQQLVTVKATVAKNASHVFSVRLSAQDLTKFVQAAQDQGMTVSEFLRNAGLSAISEKRDLTSAAKLRELQKRAEELTRAIEQLTA